MEASSGPVPSAPDISPSITKSDHLRLTFPTFGKPTDDTDPLNYLIRCQDFLALHPLADVDLLATFRTVLYGTARDWWEVARTSVFTWTEFEAVFLSAFLSEDYEDELAERVRTRTQGENEPIRDFAFCYRALCKRWKSNLTESEIVKMILKNIKPHLASQLRSRVFTVEELVKLGHQLEKDYEQQKRYESSLPHKPQSVSPRAPENRQLDKVSVQCWRCKGHHSPGNCPRYTSSFDKSFSQMQPSQSKKAQAHSSNQNFVGLPTNNAVSAIKTASSFKKKHSTSSIQSTVLHQLVIPINFGAWKGKAILDTGASYTLLHESLWKEFFLPESLQPWTSGPLYLANGQAEVPLGWINFLITLHDQSFPTRAVVLTSTSLTYAVVLGLDFIFLSGIQLNIAEGKYFFKSAPETEYYFQPGPASIPVSRTPNSPNSLSTKQLIRSQQNLTLLSAVPPPLPTIVSSEFASTLAEDQVLIDKLVKEAYLLFDEDTQLQHIMESHPTVCTRRPGRTNVLEHCLYIHQQVPIKQRPYRLSPIKQTIVKEQIQDMLNAGIIEPSHSAWASPVVLVPKKDGSLRFCVDYRKVNAITESDAYPLPNITEILESLSGASIFSTLDLNSGYWQVPMDPASKQQTAFITSGGLYQFNVMPFGLKNAPATFQRLMEIVLRELLGCICFVYIDDIIIYSPTMEQHLTDIQVILEKLQSAGLTLNLKKCKLCLREISFLGHVVNSQGVTADPSKVEAIHTYPIPENLKEVQRFLGLAGWYHRFVPNFSQIAEPLNALKKKNKSFQWTPQCQQAFDHLKACLSSPPILGHPQLQLPFTVYTDASDTGVGAVLTQRKEQGSEQVIAYASRSLNKAEINYSTTEKECLAVVWALEKWQHYLEHRLFTVVTDHSSLQWVMNSTKTTSRLIRWALRLQRFDFVLEYRKGMLNVAPDALSRVHHLPECNMYTNKTEDSEFPISPETIWSEQHGDLEITKIFQLLAEHQTPESEQYAVVEDKLYYITHLSEGKIWYRVVIPQSLVSTLLQYYHSSPLSGHLGIFKTYKRVQDVAYWQGMWTDVRRYVKNCIKCQTLKSENRKPAGKMQPIITSRPSEMIGVDIMGPLPKSSKQHEYLLVFVDYFTRWVELFPLRHATASAIAEILRKEILTRWGVPDFILSDRGTQFVSTLFTELCEKWSVTPKLTTAYHPQTNMTERINRTLKSMISAFVEDNHKSWDHHLSEFRFALNSAVQESIGMTPAELHLGRKLHSPLDKLLHGSNLLPSGPSYDVVHQVTQLQRKAKENCKRAQIRQLRSYNKNRRDVEFTEKDRVWIRNFPQSSARRNFSAKLAPKWKGPYRIIQQLGPINYRVALESTGEDVRNVHVCNLKPCFPTAEELESRSQKKLQELFQETSDEEEDFLGF